MLRSVDPPLTFRQYRLLSRIELGHVTVTQLGRLATITLPAISESVEVLVRKGLLVRRPNERDRRESLLSLTDEGKATLEQAQTVLAATARHIMSGVPSEQHSLLASDVRSIIEQVTRALVSPETVPARLPDTDFGNTLQPEQPDDDSS